MSSEGVRARSARASFSFFIHVLILSFFSLESSSCGSSSSSSSGGGGGGG